MPIEFNEVMLQDRYQLEGDKRMNPLVIQVARALQKGMGLEEVIQATIMASLVLCNGNKTHAAKKLKVTARTMRNKIDQYEWTWAFDKKESEDHDDV